MSRRRAVCSLHSTHAAGFSLLEQTGSGIGYAYAGAAASVDDASVMFFNPGRPCSARHTRGYRRRACHRPGNEVSRHRARRSRSPGSARCLRERRMTTQAMSSALANAYLAWPMNDNVAFGLRGEHAVRPQDGVRRSVGRPLPGHQERAHHDQCEPCDRREAERHEFRSASVPTISTPTPS